LTYSALMYILYFCLFCADSTRTQVYSQSLGIRKTVDG